MNIDPYEIVGTGWRLSFQRRVGRGHSSNRGALPIFATCGEGTADVLVPLPDGEEIWLSLLTAEGVATSARLPSGDLLRLTTIAAVGGEYLRAIDTMSSNGRREAIDASTIDRWDGSRSRHRHLSIAVSAFGDILPLDVTFATPEYFRYVTQIPVAPSTSSDAYGGWILP